jgi:shikimate kinase
MAAHAMIEAAAAGEPACAGMETSVTAPEADRSRHWIRHRLGSRSVVLVGLMGAGKSSIGRRLAARLDMPFRDADHEIEAAAGMTVADFFATYGEHAFRDGERRVIARLLQEGPMLLATGGGSYMDADTRARIAAAGISVWLKAELPVLMKRVRKRATRPLLQTPDPEATLQRLIDQRYPIYALADVTVESRDMPHEQVVDLVEAALRTWLAAEERSK